MNPRSYSAAKATALHDFERRYFLELRAAWPDNIKRAAEEAARSRNWLRKKYRRFGLL